MREIHTKQKKNIGYNSINEKFKTNRGLGEGRESQFSFQIYALGSARI